MCRYNFWLARVSNVWRSISISAGRSSSRRRRHLNAEALECRWLLSATLLADTFTTTANPAGGGWNDVNHGLAGRQSGSLAPIPYVESIAT
jgi:hypothetical protein